MPTPESNKSKGLDDTSFQPPPLPAEGESLEVYTDYVESLDAYEGIVRGKLAWLRGHALLRAKQVTDACYDAIIDTFGWGRSTGHLYKAIADAFDKDEVEGQSIAELRRRMTAANQESTTTDTNDPPENDPPDPTVTCGYSIKTAFADLKAIALRLRKFRDGIGDTRDAMNETQSTPTALSSMDTQFHELGELLKAADKARLEAVVATSTSRHERVVEGANMRLAVE